MNIVDNFREVCLQSNIKRQEFESFKFNDNFSECENIKENDIDTQDLRNGDAVNDSEDDEKFDTKKVTKNNSEENESGGNKVTV